VLLKRSNSAPAVEPAIVRLRRLLGAFEILLSDQTLLLAAGDHGAMLATQERSQPVFAEIISLSREDDVVTRLTSADRERVALLVKRQGDHLQKLAAKKAAVRSELDSVSQAMTRTYSLRSSYGATKNPYGAATRTSGVVSFA
jgi:hypothetical protein